MLREKVGRVGRGRVVDLVGELTLRLRENNLVQVKNTKTTFITGLKKDSNCFLLFL